MLGLIIMIAVPDTVQLCFALWALSLNTLNQLITDRSGVTAQALPVDSEGMKDEWFLLVNHFGKVAQFAPVKGLGIDVDVDTALSVDFAPGSADSPNNFLQLLQVVIGQHRA